MDSTRKRRRTPRLNRTTFRTSRLLEFCSRKELTAQTGHDPDDWPLVVLKELIDNALDACEETGVAPEITVQVTESGITVTDNGPGIPAETVEGVLDYTVRVSSREAYVAPDRGQQGNALKTLLAMPFVLDGKRGRVEIDARGVRHRIEFRVDPIRQEPIIRLVRRPGLVKNGTRVRLCWASSLRTEGRRFLQLADAFTFLNPHLRLTLRWFGKQRVIEPTAPGWAKWIPSKPTCSHWYGEPEIERLVAAYIAHDQDSGRDRPVREFIAEFGGLSGTGKQKAVLDATGLARVGLTALMNGDGLDRDRVGRLLQEMKLQTKPIKPAVLGVIGKAHFEEKFRRLGAEMDSFEYRKATVIGDDDLPVVIEAAFAWLGSGNKGGRRIVNGVNWSASIGNPFQSLGGGDYGYRDGLRGLLVEQRVGDGEPCVVALHFACPRVHFLDRGKSSLAMTRHGGTITKMVKAVTEKWAKQRRAEDRGPARSRESAFVRKYRMTIKDAAWQIMHDAYAKASYGGTLPAAARQIMYAARGEILRLTGRPELSDTYFTQNLLPAYVAEHPEECESWDVTYDARGHFAEPHTGLIVPLGTLDVRHYLAGVDRGCAASASIGMFQGDAGLYPTQGPRNRFSAVLFIEKEGFLPLFRAVQLADRYDIAIKSTKGMPVTACRQLADELCGRHGIPLLVLHDFDKAGFSIVGTLQGVTHGYMVDDYGTVRRRYHYKHDFEVVDLGLRLEDAKAWGLESEKVVYRLGRRDPRGAYARIRANLHANGATAEEIDMLCPGVGRAGKRVELNAFTSDKLIAWIEAKLLEHGVEKVIPDAATLEAAYRRAYGMALLNQHLYRIIAESEKKAAEVAVPKGIEDDLRQRLAHHPAEPWDEFLARIANRHAAMGVGPAIEGLEGAADGQ